VDHLVGVFLQAFGQGAGGRMQGHAEQTKFHWESPTWYLRHKCAGIRSEPTCWTDVSPANLGSPVQRCGYALSHATPDVSHAHDYQSLLIQQSDLTHATANTSAVTLIQRVGSALNLCYRSAVREIAKASIERRHLPEMLYAATRASFRTQLSPHRL